MVSSLIWLLLSCIDICKNPLDMEPGESNLAQPDKHPISFFFGYQGEDSEAGKSDELQNTFVLVRRGNRFRSE